VYLKSDESILLANLVNLTLIQSSILKKVYPNGHIIKDDVLHLE